MFIGLDDVGVLAAVWADTQVPGGQPELLQSMGLHVYDPPLPSTRLAALPERALD